MATGTCAADWAIMGVGHDLGTFLGRFSVEFQSIQLFLMISVSVPVQIK